MLTKKVLYLNFCFLLIFINSFSQQPVLNLLCESSINEDGGEILLSKGEVIFSEKLDSDLFLVEKFSYQGSGTSSRNYSGNYTSSEYNSYIKKYFSGLALDTFNGMDWKCYDDTILIAPKYLNNDLCCVKKFEKDIFILTKNSKSGKSFLVLSENNEYREFEVLNDLDNKMKNGMFLFDWDGDGYPEIFIITYSFGLGKTLVYLSIYKLNDA